MRNANKINMEGTTNVRSKVIDFSTIDTAGREDDAAWNSMEFYGESDGQEQSYRSPEKVNNEALRRIKARRVGITILGAMKAA